MDNLTFVVDTNFVLRFLLKDDEVQSSIAKKYFSYQQYKFVVPTVVLCEVVWVLKKSLKLSNQFIAEILQNFVLLENISVNNNEFQQGITFLLKNGDFADGIIAHNVQKYENAYLLTFDKKAQKIAKKLNLSYIEPTNL